MAECHPVGFRWVMKAKERGATIVHVDPRFTRTSAVADIHVPLRSGSDIALLGGIIRYILENERYFKEYVVNYTNAPVIITDKYSDAEDGEGFFADPSVWTKDMAIEMAAADGMTLNDRHWQVIEFMRSEHAAKGTGPTVRVLGKNSGVSVKELYELFPKGPAKTAARYAGIPKPKGCI